MTQTTTSKYPRIFSLFCGLLATLPTACGDEEQPPPRGQLPIVITGLPASLNAAVTIVGPEGFSRMVTETSTLTDLVLGSYGFTATEVEVSDDRYSPRLSATFVEVVEGLNPAINVEYLLNPGELLLNITGLPPEIEAAVEITGPNGFQQRLTELALVQNLAPGTYDLNPLDVLTEDPIVSTLFVANPLQVEIISNTAASGAVRYTRRADTGRLWLPNGSTNNEDLPRLVGYGSRQLDNSGSPNPEVQLGGDLENRSGIVFDGRGNVWLSRIDDDVRLNSLERYRADQLVDGNSPAPEVVINSDDEGSLDGAYAMGFDPDGNLWVSNTFTSSDAASLVMFTPEQIEESGSPAPTSRIFAGGPEALANPFNPAFDESGNLWVGNGGGETIFMFTPAQQSAGGTQVPARIIGGDGDNIDSPAALAFDVQGNLWAASLQFGPGQIYKLTPDQIATSGDPVPAVTIDDDQPNRLSLTTSLAFDNSGSLWVLTFDSGGILLSYREPETFQGEVSPEPDVVVSENRDSALHEFSFHPPAPGLPINTP